ncbi:hypothetical protein UPYG_G00061420 [Umbra pygmaea]|uniref:Ig-like domain-containing protein n=1 Tax=Umbra pygmaea TaxID=75934 RepID=A0ABD0X9G2_UMBPY
MDAGNYSCAVKGFDDLRSPEETLTVLYGPKNTSVSVSPSGEIVEGSSVTLTCSSDANPPVDNYTWYKKNVTSPKASGQSYNITNITSEDTGEYYCEAKNLVGSQNSKFSMINIAGTQPSYLTLIIVVIPVVLVVLIMCLCGLICFRTNRKKKPKSISDTIDKADDGKRDSIPVYAISNITTSTAAQTTETDNQEDIQYASVQFSSSKNQEVPLYSSVQQSQRQKQEEEAQYAAVKFSSPSAATCPAAQAAVEDIFEHNKA